VGGRGRSLAAASILGVGVAAGVIAVLPQLQFTHRGASLHVTLETAASLIALLAGFLVFGRLRRRGGVNELLLACALAVLSLLNICLLTMPQVSSPVSKDLLVWVVLTGRSLAAALFAVAAFASHRQLRRPVLALAASVAGLCAIVLLVAAVLNGVAGDFAHRTEAAPAPASPAGPPMAHDTALLSLQLVTAVLYGAAAAGFFRRSRQLGDEFLGWLAIAGLLAAFSHLNYSLYPYPFGQLVHNGDILRLCFYATLLVGSMREIVSYWQALSEAAVLRERQRIACDLHDGVAQELAYLARHLGSGHGPPGEEALGRLRAAVQRAQLESRRAVSALAAPSADPVEVALAQATAEVAGRYCLGLHLDLVHGVTVSAAREDALVRIACEAVANVARHSGARQACLTLESDGPRLRLRVSDRGCGFDLASAGGGFGLTSMRQRARSVGGELRLSSIPGQGSEVEATL